MKQQYVKTTVEIDQNALYQFKLKALQQGETLKGVLNQIIVRYIREPVEVDKGNGLRQWIKKMAKDRRVYWTKKDDENLARVKKKSMERLKSLQW